MCIVYWYTIVLWLTLVDQSQEPVAEPYHVGLQPRARGVGGAGMTFEAQFSFERDVLSRIRIEKKHRRFQHGGGST